MKVVPEPKGDPDKVPDQRMVWREIAALLGGRVIEGKRPTADKVAVPHGAWTIELDTFVQSNGTSPVWYTRVRAHVTGWRGMTVFARRRNVFDRVFEALGFGSRLPLAPSLLERYMVRGNPPSRVPSLFADATLAEAMFAVPSLRLRVKRASRKDRKRLGEETGEVLCTTTGIIRDVNHLAAMTRVVAETVTALERVGEIRWDPRRLGTATDRNRRGGRR